MVLQIVMYSKMFQQGQVILKIIFRIVQQVVILMSHIKTAKQSIAIFIRLSILNRATIL